MRELSNDDFVFVEVTKTFMMTKAQARRLVQVARIVTADTQVVSRDEDGTETRTFGEDFLTEDGNHDYADAAGSIPDPEGLLGVEMVGSSWQNLDEAQVLDIVRFWPEDWRIEAMKRLDQNYGDTSAKGEEND